MTYFIHITNMDELWKLHRIMEELNQTMIWDSFYAKDGKLTVSVFLDDYNIKLGLPLLRVSGLYFNP